MENCRNKNCFFNIDHFIYDPVSESIRLTPPDVLARMTAANKHWVLYQCIPHKDDLFNIFHPESGWLCLIPSGGGGHILFPFRTEFDPPAYPSVRAHTRAFLFSSFKADSGLWRCSSKRSATKA